MNEKVVINKISNKIRVLHSAALLTPPSGIVAQMEWEAQASITLGLNWRVKMYCPKANEIDAKVFHYDLSVYVEHMIRPFGKLINWVKLRRNYHNWLLSQQNKIDVFLLRYYVHDPFQLLFVLRCKKPVFFVHHTLEVPELALPKGVTGFFRSKLESILGRFTIPKAAGIVGVTEEIVDYEINRGDVKYKPTYIYPNGIIFKNVVVEDKRNKITPELLFVANFAPWHGLDVLLNSIEKSNESFVLHLVGDMQQELSDRCYDNRIKAHGSLNHQQISDLSQRCWIGLASFALSRKHMKQACPLKVREYLLLGLPVYGDYQDVFPWDALYFKKGSENISEIISFAHSVRNLKKKDVTKMAKQWIDKEILLSSFHAWLEKEYRKIYD